MKVQITHHQRGGLFSKTLALVVALMVTALAVLPSPRATAQVCTEAYLRNRQVSILNCTGENECTQPTPGGGTSTVSPNFSLGEDAVGRRINLMQALINDYGLTPEQASGVIGNFMQEAGGGTFATQC